MKYPSIATTIASLCVLTGCSADVASIFGSPGDGGAGAGSQGGAGLAQGGGSADGGSSANAPPGQTTGTGNPSTTNTTGPTTSSTTSTTVTSTSTGLPSDTTVDCDGGPCSVEQGGACCFNLDQESSSCSPSGECAGDPGTTIVTIQCQTPDDCNGQQVCCAHRQFPSSSAPYDSTICVASCDYPDLHLCDIQAPDCPTYDSPDGPIQSVCKQSTLLPDGYYVCGFNN